MVGVAGLFVIITAGLSAEAETCPPSTTCPTTVSFAVDAPGGLAISVPTSSVSLGTGTPGNQITGQLGDITVSDERATLDATWAAYVSANAGGFTTGGGTAAETIPNTDVFYWSGLATSTTGSGTFVPGQPDASAAEELAHPYTAFSKTSGSGDNSATWNPTVTVDIPSQAVSGTYTGTVNHSVA